MIRQIIYIILILLSKQGICQNTEKNDFVFIDKYSDTVIVQNFKSLPKIIDTTFLKREFDTKLLQLSDTTISYKIIIVEIKKIKKGYEYDFKINIIPITNSIEIFRRGIAL